MTVKAHATTNARVCAASCTCPARPRIDAASARSAVAPVELLDAITMPSCCSARTEYSQGAKAAPNACCDQRRLMAVRRPIPFMFGPVKKKPSCLQLFGCPAQLAECSQLRKC